MGCDIFNKTYLWSRREKRYIDSYDILVRYDIEISHLIPDIVGDRFYDLFGAFGCRSRSYYPEMSRLNYGIPPFLEGTAFGKMVSAPDTGNFGFCWIFLPDLKVSIDEYNAKLRDPELYYSDKECEQYLDYKDGFFSKEEFEKENLHVIDGLENVRKRVVQVETDLTSETSAWRKDEIMEEVDVGKTVFFIWFNN